MRRTRWTTALVVTVMSVALAEVAFGSAPWGLLFPPQWILLVPVYGAQVLLVAVVVFRVNRRPTFPALWSAGVVMGLYEFYITQVLWDDPWNEAVSNAIVEWVPLLVVTCFWHPLMAVILPLVIAEQLMSTAPTLAGLLPARIRALGPRGRWTLLIVAGFVSGGLYSRGAPWFAAPALGLSALVVWGVVVFSRRADKVDAFADALPRGWGVAGLVASVALVFAPFVAIANGAPGGEGGFGHLTAQSADRQVAALVLYAVFIVLTWRNLRHRANPPVSRLRLVPVGWRPVIVFVAVAGASAFVPAVSAPVAVLVVWGGGVPVAVWMLARSCWGSLRPVRPPGPQK